MRRWIPWLVSVPLLVCGSWSAHGLSYWLVEADGLARGQLLEATGHGYASYMPIFLATLGALLLAGLTAQTVVSTRGRRGAVAVPWALFAMPLIGFSLQEHLERLLATGMFPLDAVLEPTFLVGLALQLPFALAALAIAKVCLDVADRIERFWRSRRPAVRPARARLDRPPLDAWIPPPPALGLGYGVRGPPALH